eukprot:1131061-Amphidinium_carterae.1
MVRAHRHPEFSSLFPLFEALRFPNAFGGTACFALLAAFVESLRPLLTRQTSNMPATVWDNL